MPYILCRSLREDFAPSLPHPLPVPPVAGGSPITRLPITIQTCPHSTGTSPVLTVVACRRMAARVEIPSCNGTGAIKRFRRFGRARVGGGGGGGLESSLRNVRRETRTNGTKEPCGGGMDKKIRVLYTYMPLLRGSRPRPPLLTPYRFCLSIARTRTLSYPPREPPRRLASDLRLNHLTRDGKDRCACA